MLLVGFVVGAAIGLAAGLGLLAALGVGVIGVVVAFVLPIPLGLLSARSAGRAVPVDLTVPVQEPLSPAAYERLPLSSRNGVIARAVATAAGESAENVARALPEMLGRQRISNLASQQRASSISAAVAAHRAIDVARYRAILEGELDLAGKGCVPRDDRNRARLEQNLAQSGLQLDENLVRSMILDTRLVRLGLTVTDLMSGALSGDYDLAFAVGTIRKVGERHASEMAKIR